MNDCVAKLIEPRQLAEGLEKPSPQQAQAPGEKEDSHHKEANSVFNEEELLRRFMGDRSLASEIVDGFLRHVPSQLRDLEERLGQGDLVGARRQAHSIKGAALTVSAGALSAVAYEVENAAHAGELERAVRLFPDVSEEFEQLRTALSASGWV